MTGHSPAQARPVVPELPGSRVSVGVWRRQGPDLLLLTRWPRPAPPVHRPAPARQQTTGPRALGPRAQAWEPLPSSWGFAFAGGDPASEQEAAWCRVRTLGASRGERGLEQQDLTEGEDEGALLGPSLSPVVGIAGGTSVVGGGQTRTAAARRQAGWNPTWPLRSGDGSCQRPAGSTRHTSGFVVPRPRGAAQRHEVAELTLRPLRRHPGGGRRRVYARLSHCPRVPVVQRDGSEDCTPGSGPTGLRLGDASLREAPCLVFLPVVSLF